MTAVLCRHFGLRHMEVAEDVASDTFLKASESWAVNGVPENPTAWLYTAAKNKARDYLRRNALFETKIRETLRPSESEAGPDIDFSRQYIADSQLAMIFAVCNPVNAPESQISLALQILCGFSVEEIANAFLTKKETVKKRLMRARANLRGDHFQLAPLSEAAIRSRLDAVLATLYLLFNEGYFSKTNNLVVRKEVCSEAVRLTLVLTENELTDTPQVNALLALMCYQSSRLEARVNDKGEAILFDEQDKGLWDESLVARGNYYLVNACGGNAVSRYHLEAGIAYWHTTPTGENKWPHILQLYNQLILVAYSPVTALNRAFAYAKVYGCEAALPEVEKLDLAHHSQYHALMGYLLATVAPAKAVCHYEQAIRLTNSQSEKRTLKRELGRLKAKAAQT